jgi:hypothetical protein
MSSFADRIILLKQRASDITTKLSTLADQRKSISLPASEGEKTAAQQIVDLDFESDGLRRERDTLGSAIEHAEQLQAQETLDLQQQLVRERDHKAYTTARAVIALNLETDELMQKLSQLCERRGHLLQELGQSFDASFVTRLSGRGALTRAACAHGLHRFVSIETCAPGSMRPLADTNPLLLGIGRASKSDARPKFKEDA